MTVPTTGAAGRDAGIDASPGTTAGWLRASGAAWFVGLCLLVAAISTLASGAMQALVPFALAFLPAVIAIGLAWREGHGALRRLLQLAHDQTRGPSLVPGPAAARRLGARGDRRRGRPGAAGHEPLRPLDADRPDRPAGRLPAGRRGGARLAWLRRAQGDGGHVAPAGRARAGDPMGPDPRRPPAAGWDERVHGHPARGRRALLLFDHPHLGLPRDRRERPGGRPGPHGPQCGRPADVGAGSGVWRGRSGPSSRR